MIQGHKSTLRRSLLAMAVSAALMGGAPAVMAQTNAAGSIFGTSAEAGSEVVATNTGTGAVRTVKADENGRFQLTSLPPGTYTVEMKTGGRTVSSRSVLVSIGTGSAVDFGTAELEEVVVTGMRSADIDVTATDTRTVFSAEDLERMTVGLSIEDISLLAPGTVRGDSRYNTDRGRASISFGGSGANENAFYINGYAVTDPQRGLGSSSLPFNSIAQMQLLTGGYGAEFGRSTGGVVSIVTKRGGNKWAAGVSTSYTPSSLSASRHDVYYPANGTASDNVLWAENSKRDIDSFMYSGYVSGPIIRDKLFVYLSGEMEKRPDEGPRSIRNTTGTSANQGSDGWFDRDYDVPRWLAKVDWNIAEGHTLELTGISDVQKQTQNYYDYWYTQNGPGGLSPNTKGEESTGGLYLKEGGETYIAKYTGALRSNLLFSALYGQSKNVHKELPLNYDATVTPVRDNRSTVTTPLSFGALTVLNDPNAYDKSDGYRLDLEWLLGAHSLRGGYDVQNLEVQDGTVTAGPGYLWAYDNSSSNPIPGSGGAAHPGGNGDYVTRTITQTGGVFKAEQYAYYIEDRWQVTNQMMLSLGLRNENFKNFSASGATFLNQSNQWAPRLGVSYDVFGDSRTRVFANAGRYHLAIPLNLAFRQVGAATNTDEYFSFTSIDPATGVPQGLVALGNGPYSNNGEYGEARDPLLAAAQNLKAYYQDEFALGFETKIHTDWVGGARFIHRKLGSQIDDICDARPAYNWAVRNGYASGVDAGDLLAGSSTPNGLDDGAEHFGAQLYHCVIVNPGEANTIRLNAGTDANPNYVFAELSAADIGLPKVKRKYQGVDLFLEHPFRNNWYGKVDWTISRSRGNAEGQLLSDIGQQDVAVTLNWDYAELMSGASGPLPNDRTHQIKAYGFYQFTPEWRFSATLTAASGRPRSPSGYYGGEALVDIEPTAVGTCDATCFFENYADYGGPYYRWVNGEESDRGSGGRLPWLRMLDVGVNYSPGNFRGLSMGLDVFNILNTQKVQNVVDYAMANRAGAPYHSFGKALTYNAPRSFRFTVRYDWQQ